MSADEEKGRLSSHSQSRLSKLTGAVSRFSSNLDLFKVEPYFCIQGNPTSASMCGGIITLLLIAISIYLAGWPFQSPYVSSIDLVDDKAYLYRGSEHPIAINITLPPNSPPLLGNATINFGCTYTTPQESTYVFKGYGVSCEYGDFCIPQDFQCTLYSFLNKTQSSITLSLSLCQSENVTGCDVSFLSNLSYINVSLSYYSDEISLTEPDFDRQPITKSISITNLNSATLDETVELNYFYTNTHLKGIFGFGTRRLSSVRYPQTYLSVYGQIPSFFGYSEGDSVFAYTLRMSHTSKQITKHFPSITEWISQIVSFISIMTVVIGFFMSHYERNIMLLKLSSYDSYAIRENGTQVDFSQASWRTIITSFLYHDWFLRCLPNCIRSHFKYHFKSLEQKYMQVDIKNFFDDLKVLAPGNGQVVKIDLDLEDSEQQQQEQGAAASGELQKQIKGYVDKYCESSINAAQLGVFMGFVRIQNFDCKKAIYGLELLFGKYRHTEGVQYQFLREEYNKYRKQMLKSCPLEVRLRKSGAVVPFETDKVQQLLPVEQSQQVINIRIMSSIYSS